MKVIKVLKICGIISGLVISLLMFYGVHIEKYAIAVNHYDYYDEKIPQSFDGLSIAIIADTHYRVKIKKSWLDYIITKVNELEPDVILGLGDYIHRYKGGEIKTVWTKFKELKAREAIYFIIGNHDLKVNSDETYKYFNDSGLSLEHKHAVLTRGEDKLVFAGTGDFWRGNPGIEKALDGAPKDAYTILMVHNPDIANLKTARHIDLYLAGHTHGGQFVIPFTEYTPALPVYDLSFTQGFITTKEGKKVFISAGLGWGDMPLRFNRPPEISVLTLRRE